MSDSQTVIEFNVGLVKAMLQARYKHLLLNMEQPVEHCVELVKNWFNSDSGLNMVRTGQFRFRVSRVEHVDDGWKLQITPIENMNERTAEFTSCGNWTYVGYAYMSDWLYRKQKLCGQDIHTIVEIHPIYDAEKTKHLKRCEMTVSNYDDEQLFKLPIGDAHQIVAILGDYLSKQ